MKYKIYLFGFYITYIPFIGRQPLNITIPATQRVDVELKPYQTKWLTCQADGVPPPNITWYKVRKMLILCLTI